MNPVKLGQPGAARRTIPQVTFPFVKGHGTGNDFVVLPDLDGSIHPDLDPALVTHLCDRRRGIGADGVLRVLRRESGNATWFMDYRNADGSVSKMCGNGVRVFVRYLLDAGLVEANPSDGQLLIDTRDGVKAVTLCDDGEMSVNMGPARVGDPVDIDSGGRWYPGRQVDVGNPHAVVFVDTLEDIGELRAPLAASESFPDGVNLEFVELAHSTRLRMRVHERGVGETLSCGTGACAAVAAHRAADDSANPPAYSVEVLGGTLTVTVDDAADLHLKGAAVLVADGTWRA